MGNTILAESIKSPEDILKMLPGEAEAEIETLHLIGLFNDGTSRIVFSTQGNGCEVRATLSAVLRSALLSGGQRFILQHNHPSGDPKPSYADLLFTRRFESGMKAIGLLLTDHIILAANGIYSFRRAGII